MEIFRFVFFVNFEILQQLMASTKSSFLSIYPRSTLNKKHSGTAKSMLNPLKLDFFFFETFRFAAFFSLILSFWWILHHHFLLLRSLLMPPWFEVHVVFWWQFWIPLSFFLSHVKTYPLNCPILTF